jgi:uncharacterized membrane protein YbaN (DUF454 family)
LWIIAGTFFLALGIIGVFLPLLPTTPFLLLSAACYFKGSKKMHDWLLNNRWFGSYIRNYREGKGVSAKMKTISIIVLWITIGYSTIFAVNILIMRIILVLIAIGVAIHVVRLPTLGKVNVPVTLLMA